MATIDGITAAWTVLGMAWPERIKRVLKDDAGRSIVMGALDGIEDRDVVEAAKALITERTGLYPDDNPLALIRVEAILQQERRIDRERQEAERAEQLRAEAEQLREIVKPPTPEQLALLESPEPSSRWKATAHRLICRAIRRRLEVTDEQRADLTERILEIEAELPALLEDHGDA